ncbi:DNA methyltransferase [Desulfobacterales bacterium HSG17]|nr:DNA methyltransferase [Desulfobacterales bacterium HSG17]
MKKKIKPLKELLDSVRNIEGFPIGKDEDILALSDPPYYTACPNPYINDFIEEYGTVYDEETDDYHREPFVGDVSEGKNDPIYNAHSYHTKVPHKAIMKYIEHYTNEGDIVLDGFCGTGMTGVAAQLLNRKAILSDLSPIATFIAYNYNNPVDVEEFEKEAKRILQEVEEECGWMYETDHVEPDEGIPDGLKKIREKQTEKKGKINYTVWSDVFICPYCNEEYVFWDAAVDKDVGQVLKEFSCPHCSAEIKKTGCKRATITFFDEAIQEKVTQSKQLPVLINYTWNKKRFEKYPDKEDLKIIDKINNEIIPYWIPTYKMMFKEGAWGDIWRAGYHLGITCSHHFFSKRNIWIYSVMWSKSNISLSKWALTSIQNYINKKQSYTGGGGGMPGVLYIASLVQEKNVIDVVKRKYNKLNALFSNKGQKSKCIISTQSITDLKNISSNSVDYIFTDPPFGANIMYSEANFLWESWIKVFTSNVTEAIINNSQNKKINEYFDLMLSSFRSYFKILKPNRWITVEFHNSKSNIWNSIQNALVKAGFIIAQTTILDKKQGSFKQVTAAGTTKHDLVISAYKPKQSFETRFITNAGENLEQDFIKMHLGQLPTEPTIERTEQMLYSKLLAYYIQRGYAIKYDAVTFYKMLRQNFVEQDGCFFNEEQIANYRLYKQKMKLDELDQDSTNQMMLFVSDEKSAIVWLNAFLNKAKDFKTVHPAFTKISNISGDNVPDIKDLLDKNFIYKNGKYRRPKTEDEKLAITQKRERELLREFEQLLTEAQASKKKIKQCRKQAVIHGFEQCYKNNRFEDILTIGKRLHKNIIENDSEITEFIEVAEVKIEGF